MNKNLTEIVVVLDESGSMGSVRGDTIIGFNTMLADQQKQTDGKALLTLVTFSYHMRTIINGVDVNEVEPLNASKYRPAGGTALLDAIGFTIEMLEDRYTEEEDESKVPSKVMFIIITDGEENVSKTYLDKKQIEKMIQHQTKRHGYEFVFLGANLDAVKEGSSIGVSSTSSINYTADSGGLADSFSVLSKTTSALRNGTYTADTLYANAAGTSLDAKKDVLKNATFKNDQI